METWASLYSQGCPDFVPGRPSCSLACLAPTPVHCSPGCPLLSTPTLCCCVPLLGVPFPPASGLLLHSFPSPFAHSSSILYSGTTTCQAELLRVRQWGYSSQEDIPVHVGHVSRSGGRRGRTAVSWLLLWRGSTGTEPTFSEILPTLQGQQSHSCHSALLHSFIYKYLMSVDSIPSTTVGTRDSAVNKRWKLSLGVGLEVPREQGLGRHFSRSQE